MESVGILLEQTQSKMDILGLSENHLHIDITDDQLVIEGFTFIRKDRLNG